MRPASYLYLITRVHGLSTHLLSEDDVRALSRTRDLVAFVEAVSKGDYAEKIGLLSRELINARNLNKVFSEVYVDRLLYLLKVAPQSVDKFLDAYTRKVEIENLKRILTAKFYGLELSMDDLIQLPRTYSVINFQAMIEADNIDDAITLLMYSVYRGVGNYIQLSRECNSTIPIEAYLDKVYYRNIYKYLSGIPDEGIVRNILGVEIDLRNLYFIISYKLMDAPQNLIEVSIIKPYYRLSEDYIYSFIRAGKDAILDNFLASPYGWASDAISPSIEAASIADLEHGVNSVLLGFLKEMATRNALGMGYILWYLNAIYYEYRNLTTIAFAKELNIPEDEIKLIL